MLGLEQHIAEHDAFGFTVIPPEKVAPKKFHAGLRDAVLRLHERRTGQHIDPADVDRARLNGRGPLAAHMGFIGEDPIFEEALMNPAALTMARYLCGKSVILSDVFALMKHQGPEPTHLLHHDQSATPPPLPQYAQLVNVTWTLTDYTLGNGALAVVPGSHRFGKMPELYEEDFLKPDALVKAIPVECEAGSLIVFGGTTWHGAFPRENEGLRLNLAMTYIRPYMRPTRDYRNELSKEVLARNDDEFARIMGLYELYPLESGIETDPTPELAARLNRSKKAFRDAGRNPWG
jgi:ectoine hydroxylase-related dioxygenase (phytanoyl-CoA dioxygenase family)